MSDSNIMAAPKAMPTIEEMCEYAKPIVLKMISTSKYTVGMPDEQREEVVQEAYIRLIRAYDRVEADKGWKSFVYNHCIGAVMDYAKAGHGFEEDSWSIRKTEEHNAVHVHKMKKRLDMVNKEGDEIDIDTLLGINGKFSELDLDSPKINWTHLAKMAATDKELHVFLKHIRGEKQEQIGRVLGLTRASIGQMIESFTARFDDPAWAVDLAKKSWFDQIIWCLGLARTFNIPDKDQQEIYGIPLGHHSEPIDLNNSKPKVLYHNEQSELFGLMN